VRVFVCQCVRMYIDRQMIGKIDFQDSKTRAQQFIRG